MRLYYYCAIVRQVSDWAKNPNHFRELHPEVSCGDAVLRVAHAGVNPPDGWHKPNGHLANDAIERMPTMKDLIHALAP